MDQSQLIDYALDLLDASARAEAERAIAADAEAQARLVELRRDLGLLANASEPVTPSPALRGRILDATAPQPSFVGMIPRVGAFFDLPAERVETLLGAAREIARPRWRQLHPGISLMRVKAGPRRSSHRCALAFMAADTQFPHHIHAGDEWALLIDGYIRESTGLEFHSGDLLHKPAGSSHSFRTVEVHCLFAVASVEHPE
jgi:anti-sigma factor RsiW